MKKTGLFILMLFPFILFAQEPAKDSKAMALLDKATAAFDGKKGITADFIITLENTRDDKKESIPGKIWLKGEKFRLSIRDVETFFDGKTQSVYMKDAQEVTISNPDEEDLKEINPLMLLKSYQTGYKMKFVETVQEDGKSLDVIDLYPEELKSPHARITISIEKETMWLHSVRIQGKDGINTVLMIKKYDLTPIQDTFFVFNPKEINGIEVVDLR